MVSMIGDWIISEFSRLETIKNTFTFNDLELNITEK